MPGPLSRGVDKALRHPYWTAIGVIVATLFGVTQMVLSWDGGSRPNTSPIVGLKTKTTGAEQVTVFTGPSDGQQAYGSAGPPLGAASDVVLRCSMLGSPVGTNDNRLWYFVSYDRDGSTETGWLPDHELVTGQPGVSVRPACLGNINDPTVGDVSPNVPAGPYPVLADEGATVPVRAVSDQASSSIRELNSGDIVVLSCSVKGPVVNGAPRALGATVSNDDWDKITTPIEGWVPDSNVDSHSPTSVAPPCPAP